MARYKRVLKSSRLEAGKLMTKKQMTSCNAIIHTASVACGALGFIPIPVADAIPITSAQVTMVMSLGKVFGISVGETAAKTILSAVVAPLVGRTIASALLKFVPGVGWVISGAVAAGITEAVGWIIANDFARQYRNEYNMRSQAEYVQFAEQRVREAEARAKAAEEEAKAAWDIDLENLDDPGNQM